MKKHSYLVCRVLLLATLVGVATAAAGQTVEVYKRSSCGCCAKWVEHLRVNGFTAKVHDAEEIDAVKEKQGVPKELSSCHTAVVGGYVIEGHVPADLIRKLLVEHPKARGLAVPSMPLGSPGMEGARKIDYQVLLIKDTGQYVTYAMR